MVVIRLRAENALGAWGTPLAQDDGLYFYSPA